MSETSLQAINRIEHPEPNHSPAQVAQVEAANRVQETAAARRAEGKEKSAAAAEPKNQPIMNNLSDVRLKFQVDPKTNDVTVLVLDKTTQKVIRTIPSEDIKKLSQGELFGLSA